LSAASHCFSVLNLGDAFRAPWASGSKNCKYASAGVASKGDYRNADAEQQQSGHARFHDGSFTLVKSVLGQTYPMIL
jgi:hypothetical protein